MKTEKFPSAIVSLLTVIGLGAFAMIANISLSSCVASGETFTYTNSSGTPVTITGFGAWCENHLTVIRGATKTSVVLTATALQSKGTSTAKIVTLVKSTETVLQPLLNQTTVSQADIDSALSTISVNDSTGIYALAIEPAIELVGGYIVELKNEGAPAKVTVDVATALLNGLNDAVNVLSPTAMLKVHSTLRPPFGSVKPESAFDLRVCVSKNQ